VSCAWVQRVSWVVSRTALYLLLAALDPRLALIFLGWAACEAHRWEREQLLTWYRQFLPVARERLRKLDVLQALVDEGWTLVPPTKKNIVRTTNLARELGQKYQLAKAKTDGREH
jgi:hypothetical protein